MFSILRILKNQGLKYTTFRLLYEAKRKLGWMKISFPRDPKARHYISFKDWNRSQIPFFIESRESLNIRRRPTEALKRKVDKINEGYNQMFNHEWTPVNDWLTNPSTGYRYSANTHWSQIEDLSSEAGDIKYVWEKSRFSYLHDLIRYDYHFEEDLAEKVLGDMMDWIEANPINMGPHYRCSQEISLRCLNWIYAIHYYRNSDVFTEDRWQRIIHYIYWQVKHVYANIGFSRICVRNNHAITECLMIFVAGLLFPFFDEAKQWKANGVTWLEEEIDYQIYDDGTYLQHSHNYQRVLVQLLSWFIAISKLHQISLRSSTINKARTTLQYMVNTCIGKDGQLPNYGSNDGALFFRWTDQDYSDYRPQINALHYQLHGTIIYDKIEEIQWLGGEITSDMIKEPIVNNDIRLYDQGGIHTITSQGSFTFFKCMRYKDRPAQADNMHLDIWINGFNYLRDSGTYKYNTTPQLTKYFMGTAGHNAVMIGTLDQMTKGPRFIWYNWTKDTRSEIIETDEKYMINAEAEMFFDLPSPVRHIRKVVKDKDAYLWQIDDVIVGNTDGNHIRQLWHPNPEVISRISISATDEYDQELLLQKTTGWWSAYYGHKEEVPVWYFESDSLQIKTRIQIS